MNARKISPFTKIENALVELICARIVATDREQWRYTEFGREG